MKVSIVIPVFNDTQALFELVERLFVVIDIAGWDVEVLIVDDGSESHVWSELERIKSFFQDRKIMLFKLVRNEGQHKATLFGIMRCSHDVIVTMDSDLQHPPEEAPRLVEALLVGNFDLVYGSASVGHSYIRRAAGYIFFKVSSLSKGDAVRGSAFRAMTKKTASKLIQEADPSFLLIDAILRKMNLSMVRVETVHNKRKYGKSSYSLRSLFLMALKGFWFYMLPESYRNRSHSK